LLPKNPYLLHDNINIIDQKENEKKDITHSEPFIKKQAIEISDMW